MKCFSNFVQYLNMPLKLLTSGRLPVILSQYLKHNQPLFRAMATKVDSTFISEINAAEKVIEKGITS